MSGGYEAQILEVAPLGEMKLLTPSLPNEMTYAVHRPRVIQPKSWGELPPLRWVLLALLG